MEQSHHAPESLKLVMYSEDAYILHLGNKYEEKILHAQKIMDPVITVKNINGCNTSIPLERALDLLEKYHKLRVKFAKHLEAVNQIKTSSENEKEVVKKSVSSKKLAIAGSY